MHDSVFLAMNYLAHLYLSGNDQDLLLGNFIADAVKGKQYLDYSPGVSNGIVLHRSIDTFMDENPIVKQGTKRLHANYGKFSSVIIDIFYDHFLATYWKEYHTEELPNYVSGVYSELDTRKKEMPDKIQHLFHYMSTQDWLSSYARLNGIEKVLNGMSRRIRIQENFHESYRELIQYYDEYQQEFLEYFPQVIAHCEEIKHGFKIQK